MFMIRREDLISVWKLRFSLYSNVDLLGQMIYLQHDMKEKILQPFFTTKKGTQGTGLGLSITNDIVNAHGGQISIESEPGSTCFRITLLN
jgi:nitrogen-specific signal transduction histidine kinase